MTMTDANGLTKKAEDLGLYSWESQPIVCDLWIVLQLKLHQNTGHNWDKLITNIKASPELFTGVFCDVLLCFPEGKVSANHSQRNDSEWPPQLAFEMPAQNYASNATFTVCQRSLVHIICGSRWIMQKALACFEHHLRSKMTCAMLAVTKAKTQR